MTTTRTTQTTDRNLTALAGKLAQIAELTAEAEALKWTILDTREIGTQTAVSKLYGVTRSAVGQWITARDEAKAGPLVPAPREAGDTQDARKTA